MEFSSLKWSRVSAQNFHQDRGRCGWHWRMRFVQPQWECTTKFGEHKLNPGWAHRGQTRLCWSCFDALTSVCGFIFLLFTTFSFFFFYCFLALLLFVSLGQSLLSASLFSHENGAQMWRGTYVSLMLKHSLIYQTVPSCSAMTGLNYSAWVCSSTASQTPPFPVLCVCVCVCKHGCESDCQIRLGKWYTCLNCIVLPRT